MLGASGSTLRGAGGAWRLSSPAHPRVTATATIRTLAGEWDLAVEIVACRQTNDSRASWHPHSICSLRTAGCGQRPPRRRGAGAEVREDLGDDRCLGDAGDDPHRAVTGGTRERVDREALLEQRRRRAYAHRRLASVGASRGAGTRASGPAAGEEFQSGRVDYPCLVQ